MANNIVHQYSILKFRSILRCIGSCFLFLFFSMTIDHFHLPVRRKKSHREINVSNAKNEF